MNCANVIHMLFKWIIKLRTKMWKTSKLFLKTKSWNFRNRSLYDWSKCLNNMWGLIKGDDFFQRRILLVVSTESHHSKVQTLSELCDIPKRPTDNMPTFTLTEFFTIVHHVRGDPKIFSAVLYWNVNCRLNWIWLIERFPGSRRLSFFCESSVFGIPNKSFDLDMY